MRVVLDLSMVGGICISSLSFKTHDHPYGKKYKLLAHHIFREYVHTNSSDWCTKFFFLIRFRSFESFMIMGLLRLPYVIKPNTNYDTEISKCIA